MKLHVAKHATPPPATDPATSQKLTDPGAQKPNEPELPVGRPHPPAGLDGFSPVALWHDRKWTRGDAHFAAEHQGIVFHMASAEELAKFQAGPEQYVPQLLGCDPVIMFETDRAVTGNTQFGAYFQGKLFLFSSSDTRAKFRDNPERYSRTRHVLLDDEIPESITR
jgi:YHS domain-containing protein